MKANELPKEDIVLFEKMKNNYVSEKERIFFETIKKREEEHNANVDDLLWNYEKNSLWFYRFEYNWYMLHVPIKNKPYGEKFEFTCLSDLLEFELHKVENANVDNDIHNILEYLRKTDYEGIKYDHCEDA